MGKIAEDFKSALERRKATALLNTAMQHGGLDKDFPGFSTLQEWSSWKIHNILQLGKYHWNGADPWPDAELALMSTAEYLMLRFIDFLVKATVAGMCIGYYQSDLEYQEMNWGEIFGDENWLPILTRFAREFADDKDALQVIHDEFMTAAQYFSGAMNFAQHTGKETCHVWDLWKASLEACTTKFFTAGVETGKKWKEEEILTGIAKATEGFPE